MREKILAGRYVLVEQIGVGGMAIVYRAIDRNTGHSVAVKVLKPEFNRDVEFVSRFQREAEAASKMTHHNIVNLLDVGMDGENRYLIMEYVKGKTLKEVIQEKGRLSPAVAVQITIRILSALQHAHQNGIIHRDIKPQNILVHSDGHIKVADFGIARMANSSTLTKGDSVMGSVHYFSPEQAQGQGTDVTSDLYSVGVTLYEMLTGRVPFDGDSPVAVAMQHLHAVPENIRNYAPEVSEAICHVCLKAMEKNPQYRYHSAREMASELRMALEGRVTDLQPRLVEKALHTPPAKVTPVRKTSVRQQTGRNARQPNAALWWILTAVVALVLVAGMFVMITSLDSCGSFGNDVEVDLYEGLDRATAQRKVEAQGLEALIYEGKHDTVAAGYVISQYPAMGATLHKGDTVVLTVSTGPHKKTVPSILNKTIQDAQTTLKQYGLTLSVVEREVSQVYARDFILRQDPVAGSECQDGDIIQVVVSGGVAYVPSATGKLLNEAREQIASAGLKLSPTIKYVDAADEALHGRVNSQSHSAGSQVIQGTTITLTVCRVPSLMKKAEITLELPESDAVTTVRATLSDEFGDEYTIFQDSFPANVSRRPKVVLQAIDAGMFNIRIYVDEVHKYSQWVTFE